MFTKKIMKIIIANSISALALMFLLLSFHSEAKGVVPKIIRVDLDAPGPVHDGTNWNSAFTNLRSAIDAATNGAGDEIWVASGIYTPTLNSANGRHETFMLKSNTSIYGGFAGTETTRDQRNWKTNLTVLSGDLHGDDVTDAHGVITDVNKIIGENAYNVLSAAIMGGIVLDGITITGGKADSISDHWRGGGLNNYSTAITLQNVIFSGNYAVSYGGGLSNGSGYVTMKNVDFINNFANYRGGGVHSEYGSFSISDSLVSGNVANNDGGGMVIFNNAGNTTLINVTFINNRANLTDGGGLVLWAVNSTVINNKFIGNTSGRSGGGMDLMYDNFSIVNNLFDGNQAVASGGAAHILEAKKSRIINSTFSANNITGTGTNNYGGGIAIVNSSWITMTNSIVWDNTGLASPEIYRQTGSTLNIQYSDVDFTGVNGYTDGGHNLSTNPLFIDANGIDNIIGTLDDNLRLLRTSPVIDAGDNTALPADTYDLDGDLNLTELIPLDLYLAPRFMEVPTIADTGSGTQPIVDMGAIETWFINLFLPNVQR